MRIPRVAKLDGVAEAVRKSHHDAIVELQGLPMSGALLVGDVTIPDNSLVIVSHKLGRAPRMVLCSPIKVPFGVVVPTAGFIVDSLGSGVDRSQSLRLGAFLFGVEVVVTVAVL